jgi:hypothetical protein
MEAFCLFRWYTSGEHTASTGKQNNLKFGNKVLFAIRNSFVYLETVAKKEVISGKGRFLEKRQGD